MTKIRIDLEERVDNFGKKFYVGKLKGPYLIDCNEKTTGGACFLIFLSEPGYEELQIAPINSIPKKDNKKNKKTKKPKVYKIVNKEKNDSL